MDGFDNVATLMQKLIYELEGDYRAWYEKAARLNFYAWRVSAALSLAISATAAVVAELIEGKQFDEWGKAVLTVLPLLATALTAVISHYKFHEKEALREAGRIEVEDIIRNAKILAASARNEEALLTAYHQVRQRTHDLEIRQHTNDVALRSQEKTTEVR
jgi:hypothetical protein